MRRKGRRKGLFLISELKGEDSKNVAKGGGGGGGGFDIASICFEEL